MLCLNDIMTRTVLTLRPDATLRDAVETFVSHHVSGAPVATGGRIVGVVSTTDIFEFEAAAGAEPPVRVEEPQWDEEPLEEDQEGDDPPPTEYFSESLDESSADVVSRFNPTPSAEWDTLSEHTVSEVMTQVLFSLPPSATVAEAARYMREAEIHRVLVMEGDALVGIVTTTDITDAVADERIGV